MSGLFIPDEGRSFSAIYSLGPWVNYQLDDVAGPYGARVVLLSCLLFVGFLSYKFLTHSGVSERNAMVVSVFFAFDPILLYSSQYGRADVWCLLFAVGGLFLARKRSYGLVSAIFLALIPFFWITGVLYLAIVGSAIAFSIAIQREWHRLSYFVLTGILTTFFVGFFVVWSSPHAFSDSFGLTRVTGGFSDGVVWSDLLVGLAKTLIFYAAPPLALLIYLGFRDKSIFLLISALFLLLFLAFTGAYYGRAIYFVGGIWLIFLIYLWHAPKLRPISLWWVFPCVFVAVLRVLNVGLSAENPGVANLEKYLRPLISESVKVYDTTDLARHVTRASNGIYISEIFGDVAGFFEGLRPDFVIVSTGGELPIKESKITISILRKSGYCKVTDIGSSRHVISPMPHFFQRTYLGYRAVVGSIQVWSPCKSSVLP